jgi:hypothetical protein
VRFRLAMTCRKSVASITALRAAEVSQRTIPAAPQKGPPDRGINVVSFFDRAWSQGGSLSKLAKAPGTGLTTTRGEIWPTN